MGQPETNASPPIGSLAFPAWRLGQMLRGTPAGVVMVWGFDGWIRVRIRPTSARRPSLFTFYDCRSLACGRSGVALSTKARLSAPPSASFSLRPARSGGGS